MSLQVWLPLNGDTKNHGCLKGSFTVGTTPTYVDGKIGKALSVGSLTMSASQTAQVLNNQAVSICFWIYVVDSTTQTMIFGNSDMSSANNRKFSVFQYPSVNDLHLSWQNDTARTTFLGGVLYGVLPTGSWTHVAVTYDNPTCKVYINGEQKATYTGVSDSATFAYQTQLIWNNSTGSRYLNDFRLYNHCLSLKEVKEIAKALVLHYPLNDVSPTSSASKYSGSYFDGKSTSYSSGYYTQTKLTSERGYNYSMSYTGTGSNTWPSIGFPTFSFVAGKTYDWSCKVRVNSCSNVSLTMRCARMSNDWVCPNSATVVSSSLVGKGWIEYHRRATLSSTSTRSGTDYTTVPLMEFYPNSLVTSGTVYAVNFDLKDVQVCECDSDAPTNNGSWANGIVYDTSGFCNHGTSGVAIKTNYLSTGASLNSYNSGTATWDSTNSRYTIVSAVTTSSWGSGFYIPSGTVSVPYGQSYRFSAEVYVPSEHKLVVDYNNSVASGSTWNGNDNDLSSARLSSTVTIPATTWTKIVFGTQNKHASNTSSIAILPYDGFGLYTANDSASITWYMRNVKIEMNSFVTPYSSTGIGWVADTPKYSASYNMNQCGFVNFTSPFSANFYQVTYSFWIKPITNAGGYQTVYSAKNNPTGSLWLAFNTESNGLWAYQASDSPSYHKTNSFLTLNTWYHAVFVFDNGTSKWYLNGTHVGTDVTWTNSYIKYVSSMSIGNSYTGYSWNTLSNCYLSDFRIYATALSADDILELYQSPIHIADNGALIIQGEVVEG